MKEIKKTKYNIPTAKKLDCKPPQDCNLSAEQAEKAAEKAKANANSASKDAQDAKSSAEQALSSENAANQSAIDANNSKNQAETLQGQAAAAAAAANNVLVSIQPVVNNISSIQNVENNLTQINNVEQNLSEIVAIFNNLTEINNVEQALPEINAVEQKLAEIEAVFNNLSEILTVETNITQILNVEAALTEITNVNNNLTELLAIYNNLTEILDVESNLGDIIITANNIAAIIAAPQAAQDAADARDKAQEWATNPEDDPVETSPDQFSAFHWAKKAENFFPGGAVAGDLAQFNGTNWNPLTVAPGEITKNLGAGLVAVQHREALKAREPFRSAPINTYFQLKDIIAWDNADKNLPDTTVLTNLDSGQAWLPFLGPGVISYSTSKNGAFRGDGATTLQIWSSVLSWGLGSVGIEWSVRRTTMSMSTGLILAAKDTSNFIIFERNMPTGVYTGGLASVLNWRLRSVVAGVGTVLGTIDNSLIYGGGNDDAMDSTSIKWIVKYGYRGRNSASRILIYLESNPSVRLEVDVTSLNSTYVTSSDIAFVGLCGDSQPNALTERIVIAQL